MFKEGITPDLKGPNDLETVRELTTDNNYKYVIVKEGPYGHWFIKVPGVLPNKLMGAYLSYSAAKNAVEQYASTLNRTIKEAKD